MGSANIHCFSTLKRVVTMTEDRRKLCVNCAWRANCAKRFSMDSGGTLHCPDYCEDVALRKNREEQDDVVTEDN